MAICSSHPLTDRETKVLARIREHGSFTCTGGCEQRQSGQLHCVHLARELSTSNHKIWRAVGALVEMGLVDRDWDEMAGCWRFSPAEERREPPAHVAAEPA